MKIKKKGKSVVLKRIIDVVVSGIGLIILFPIFIIVGIFIKLDSKGPVFFVQERAGKDGKIFKAYKLRTMVDNAEKKGLGFEVEKNDSRITCVGKYLRWGIDELPQLINVFKGDMSLVGPRPALPYQVEKYSEREKRRLKVKPGITGWALINGRNILSWPERIKLDIWYIDHWSLWLDIKILFKTVWVVIFKREGIYGKDGVTRDYGR
ncbi:sugar transferase [Candidatus Atribacteria bacterium HGW-Atribacteria-1]|nr:MAG: sugar transferase [Candidatus Atribacteria bacterium HGW-Atribacteria-1]